MDSLDDFIDWMAELRERIEDPNQLLKQAQPSFVSLLTESVIPSTVWERGQRESVRHLLHRSDALTVFAIASPAGSTSAVHDHGSWGLVGQVAGEEIERTYQIHPADDGLVRLHPEESLHLRPGDAVKLLPPERDLHSVETVGVQTSFTLHAFASDPVQGFTYFEPELYAAHTYRGAYDNE